MERRDFLKIFSIGTVAAMSGQIVHRAVLVPETSHLSIWIPASGEWRIPLS